MTTLHLINATETHRMRITEATDNVGYEITVFEPGATGRTPAVDREVIWLAERNDYVDVEYPRTYIKSAEVVDLWLGGSDARSTSGLLYKLTVSGDRTY